jgi:predicted anti-sigma-YlaC factor YlaD
MNCVRVEELLSDYLEHALGADDRAAVDGHLQTCRACTELAAGMTEVLTWGKTFPVYEAPPSLALHIVSNTPLRTMNCVTVEGLLSDYLEHALGAGDRAVVDQHLQTCRDCAELAAGMTGVLAWGKTFPVYEAPPWLAQRIVSNTPRAARESWTETIALIWRWIIEPRTAMAVFTATLMLGWLGSVAGISPDWSAVVRNPRAIYYGAQGAVNRAYGDAIRRYYRSPIVTEIEARIQQLREIS